MAGRLDEPMRDGKSWHMRAGVVWLLVLGVLCMAADRPPWRARKRSGVFHNKLAAARVSPEDWPPEPGTPTDIDPARFGKAIRTLCGWMRPGLERNYADWTLGAASEFEVDPFVLAAMIYRQSRCRATKEDLSGIGLTLLVPEMYRSRFRRRVYRYRVHEEGRWSERELAFPRFAFVRGNLMRAESHLYLAAGLLRAWRDQAATVHAFFPQESHRHHVSHWVWGDKVPSARAEDRILTDRRRLLEYYGARTPPAPVSALGVSLHAPLDGAPRVVSSGLGSERDGGKRSHRGIDIESEFGEPVRAVADGRVVFSGVDLPGQRHNVILSVAEINSYPRAELGRGGRYICLAHDSTTHETLRSCYMHLETVLVQRGDLVRGGKTIGTVGRTGMKRSAPHLHFEFRAHAETIDPLEHFGSHVIGRPMVWDGYRIVSPEEARKRRWRKRR